MWDFAHCTTLKQIESQGIRRKLVAIVGYRDMKYALASSSTVATTRLESIGRMAIAIHPI
jgi:hypothetical protein